MHNICLLFRDNNSSMKMWFLKWFASSAFNKCPQALNNDLPGIASSDVKLHIDSKATPRDVQTPASVTIK